MSLPAAQSPELIPVAARLATHERPKVNHDPTVQLSPVAAADKKVEAVHVATCPIANPTLHAVLSHLLPVELSARNIRL